MLQQHKVLYSDKTQQLKQCKEEKKKPSLSFPTIAITRIHAKKHIHTFEHTPVHKAYFGKHGTAPRTQVRK